MLTIFRQSLMQSRNQILGWGLSLAVLGAFMIPFYDALVEQQADLISLMAQYPPELMGFFGGMEDMFTPAGYLHTEFFSYMPLILGIFAILVGSGLLASDEENGTLDLILAHPLSRAALFWGRLLAFLVSTLAILIISYMGFFVVLPTTSMEMTAGELILPFISLFAILIFFGLLALLLSLGLPSRRSAAMTSGLILVAGYFITSLRTLDESLDLMADFSPLSYYQGGNAAAAVEWGWIAGLLAFALAFGLLAWLILERRDIRVGGEGGWRFGGLRWGKKAPLA